MRHLKKISLILLAVILVSGLLVANGCKKKEAETIKIGAILPLTGDLASYGVDTRKALELAVEKLSKAGGVNGKKVSLIIEDSQGSPKLAVTAFNKLVNVDKVIGILGPITSAEVLSVAPIANKNKIVLITPSATSPDISKAGDYVFRTINDDTIESKAMARYVLEQLRIKNVGIIALEAAGTLSYANSFERFFINSAGIVKVKEIVSEEMREYRSPIMKILNQKVEAIYVSGYSKEIGQIIKQIREVNNSVNMISYQSAEDKRVVEIAGDTVNGVYFSSTTLPSDILGPANTEFVREFTINFGKPPGVFAAEIYDGINILLNAIKHVSSDKTTLLAELKKLSNYMGASGIISFDENGDVHKPIAIYKYQKREPVFITTVGME